MKQMQIQQKEAFLLSTLTPVPKKNIIYLMKKSVGIKCREKFFSQISSNSSFDQDSVCLPTVGYLLAAKSWLFIFLSEKKIKAPIYSEAVNLHQLVRQGQVPCIYVLRGHIYVAYMSETAVSEWDGGNSSGSDEDLPNRENLCVRPLSWQSIEVTGLMAQLDRKVAWCQSQ